MAGRGVVYVLHLYGHLGNGNHKANHYIGWTTDVDRRLEEHRAARLATYTPGRDAKMICHANERGIPYDVVATFPGGRDLERKLKNRKGAAGLCPLCKDAHRAKHTAQRRAQRERERESNG